MSSEWKPIDTAPKDEGKTIFVCRHKDKKHVQFEAAFFYESEERDGAHVYAPAYWSLQNMTIDQPIDDDYSDYEWSPIPAHDQERNEG